MTTIGNSISTYTEIPQAQEAKMSSGVNSSASIYSNTNMGDVSSTPTAQTPQTGQTQTKRTEQEVLNSFMSACNKHQLNPTKDELNKLIGLVSGGKTIKDLQNAENSEITRYTECLEEAIKRTPKNASGGYDIDAIGAKAQQYNIAKMGQWSIAGFEEAQKRNQESITDRINRVYKTNQTQDEKIQRYFVDFYDHRAEEALKEAKTPEERARIIEKEKKRQLQDFSRIIANSSPEEIPAIRKAIQYLQNENKIYGVDMMLAMCDTVEQRSQVATEALQDTEFTESLWKSTQEADVLGERNSIEVFTETMSELVAAQTDEDRAETRDFNLREKTQFYQKLEAIEAKIQNGEELTDEEKAFYEKAEGKKAYYKEMSVAEHVGTANSNVLTDIQQELLILHQNAQNFEDCREVYLRINEYATNNADALNMDIEEFNKMMDEATNNNYSIILKDAAEGTHTELNPPLETPTDKAKTTSTTGIGLKQIETISENQQKTIEKAADKTLKDARDKARNLRRSGDTDGAERVLIDAKYAAASLYARSNKGFYETLNKTGLSFNEGIKFAYENENILPAAFVMDAIKTFKSRPPKEQVDFIASHGLSGYNFIKKGLTLEVINLALQENSISADIRADLEMRARDLTTSQDE